MEQQAILDVICLGRFRVRAGWNFKSLLIGIFRPLLGFLLGVVGALWGRALV